MNGVPYYARALIRLVPWERMFPKLLYGAMVENSALLQVGLNRLGYIWARSLQRDYELLPTREGRSPYLKGSGDPKVIGKGLFCRIACRNHIVVSN